MYIYILICEVSLSSQFKIIKKKKKEKVIIQIVRNRTVFVLEKERININKGKEESIKFRSKDLFPTDLKKRTP